MSPRAALLAAALLAAAPACAVDPGAAAAEAAEGASVPELPGSDILDGCSRPYVNAPPLPEAAGAVVVARFSPRSTPAQIVKLRFVGALGGQCSDLPTEVLFWSSAAEDPEVAPEGVRTARVGSTAGEVSVVLDPPLEVPADRPYVYAGVRLAAEGGRSVCVVGCTRYGGAYWVSLEPAPPYDWIGPGFGNFVIQAYAAYPPG